jgi:hypothetical protein
MLSGIVPPWNFSNLNRIAPPKEDVMISQSCDFDEFLERVRDRGYLEVIYLADKETTEAERFKYRLGARRLTPSEVCAGYADVLKAFIRFMRYGVKSSSMKGSQQEGLQAFREAALENYLEVVEHMEASGGMEKRDAEIWLRGKPRVKRWRPLTRYPCRFPRIPGRTRDRRRQYGCLTMKLFCVSSPL